jgi:hypothetical protein
VARSDLSLQHPAAQALQIVGGTDQSVKLIVLIEVIEIDYQSF